MFLDIRLSGFSTPRTPRSISKILDFVEEASSMALYSRIHTLHSLGGAFLVT